MATTTNYSWTTPDDTALVKDGAAAIRTLGSSVDTTTKALNPETTLGDLAYRSSTANVKTRLGLGTAGQVLQVNSGANAPEWATPSSGGMTLLSTTTLSGTSTTVSSISGAYNNLLVIINNPFLSAGQTLRINPNSTDSISNQSRLQADTGQQTASISSNGAAFLPTTSTPANTFCLQIFNYAQTSNGKNFFFSGCHGTTNSVFGGGVIQTNSAISSLQFTTASGAPTFSGGTVLIYGVK
jgi:hypothetical protein